MSGDVAAFLGLDSRWKVNDLLGSSLLCSRYVGEDRECVSVATQHSGPKLPELLETAGILMI